MVDQRAPPARKGLEASTVAARLGFPRPYTTGTTAPTGPCASRPTSTKQGRNALRAAQSRIALRDSKHPELPWVAVSREARSELTRAPGIGSPLQH